MAQQKNLSQNNDLLERFTASFAGLRSHSNLPNGTTPFIWAIAVLLIVIFAAFYLNVRSNNEAILRTNLMKSTAKVADNIEMRLRASSASMARPYRAAGTGRKYGGSSEQILSGAAQQQPGNHFDPTDRTKRKRHRIHG